MVINEVIEEEDEDKNNNKITNSKIMEDCVSNIEEKDNNDDSVLVNNIKIIHLNEKKNISENRNNIVNKTDNNLIFNKINRKSNKFIISTGKWNPLSSYLTDSKENIITYKNNFYKYTSLREKVLFNNSSNNNTNSKITLPSIISMKTNNNIENNNTKKLRPIKLNHANIINETPSTSAATNSTKKNLNNKQNLTEDVSKFRTGLLSAGSSFNGNNNIIIPMLPLKRPVSNFNFGGGQLWDNINSNVNNIIRSKEKIGDTFDSQKNDIIPSEDNIKNNVFSLYKMPTRNKTFKSQDIKKKFDFSENGYDLYDVNKMIPKLHKIKIEKGIMNNKFANVLGKKVIDCQKYLDNNPFSSLVNNNKFRTRSYKSD